MSRSTIGGGSTIKTYQTQDEANNDLAAGRLDYIQADGSALDAFLKTEQGKACCELKAAVPDDKEILGEGVGGGIRKEDTELKEKLDKALSELAKIGRVREDHRQISRTRRQDDRPQDVMQQGRLSLATGGQPSSGRGP